MTSSPLKNWGAREGGGSDETLRIIFCGHVNVPKMNQGISVYGETKSNNHEGHDFKILPFGACKFDLYKKNITNPENYVSFARDKSFFKRMLFHSLYKVSIGFGGRDFLKKIILGERMGGQKKFKGGWSTMDYAMEVWLVYGGHLCIKRFINSLKQVHHQSICFNRSISWNIYIYNF